MKSILERSAKEGWRGIAHLFSVVDLPEEGLPTRPISGSRGMSNKRKERRTGYQRRVVEC